MMKHTSLVLTTLLLIPGILPGQDSRVDEADKAVEAARAATEAAEARVAGAYALLCSDFDFLRSDAWSRLREPVLNGVDSAAAAWRKDPALDLESLVREQLAKSGLLAGVTMDLLSADITAVLCNSGGAPIGEVVEAAQKLLFPEQEFEACWPSLHGRLDTVKDLVAAHRTLSEAVSARKALDAAPVDPGSPPGMVLVPRGRFKFGPWTGWEDDLEGARIPNKVKSVRTQGYYIDIHEVTNTQFLKFLAGLSAEKTVREYLPSGFTMAEGGKVLGPEGKDLFPVVGVTLGAAMAYAKSVGKRLPTEEEWERAARGEEGRAYPWGSRLEKDAANWRGRNLGGPAAVGAHPKDRSSYGVMDMAGNVSELTMDLDGRRPAKGSLEATDFVVTRGGNFEEGEGALANGYRWVLPAVGGKSEAVGFRCVISEKDWTPK